ncbi:MAG: ectonucleotide pyrophosphatase/phosphodiesterase [Gemmatimonadales bacterium]
MSTSHQEVAAESTSILRWLAAGAAMLAFVHTGACGQTPSPRDVRATVVLVSLDGFRYDYLDRYPSPSLHRLMANGVRAPLIPVFPTKTFPNHYTVVTGLYPEHHGIVENTIYDPVFDTVFRITDTAAVADARWWSGEPLWATAQTQGQIAAAYFWPGSEAPIGGVRPRYWEHYSSAVPNATRVRQVLDWLILPADQRPTFVTLYLSDVDSKGHDWGPDSPEVAAAILRVDSAVGMLMDGINQRGLEGHVSVIIVSDHGMSATSPDRVVALDDYLTLDWLARIIGGSPILGLWPKPGMEDRVVRALRGKHPHLAVWRKAEIPARFRYRDHRRIAPILALADPGWSVAARRRDVTEHPERYRGGSHGYDDTLAVMRAIFLAQGPAFNSASVAPALRNVHLYELMARILGLTPAPNDGSADSVATLLRPAPVR